MIALSATRNMKTDRFSIYVMNDDGSNLRQLTQDCPYGCSRPRWSPDGTQIIFRSTSREQNRQLPAESFAINLDGSNLRRLTEHTSYENIRFANWLPNGRIALHTLDGWRVYEMNDDMTGGHYTVAPPRQYAVVAMSPDGQRVILVKKNFEFNEHYLANADGTNIHRPLDDHIPRRALLWSPDSQHIAFVSSDHKKDVLCVMNADWTNVRQLGDIKFEGGFVWSPDSQYLAFEGLKDGQSAIFVNNAYGTDHRHLASFDLGPDKGRLFTQTPSWSPNSQHLVFNTWQDGSMHLYRIAADGTQHQHLTPDTPTLAMVYDLAWGPNTDQNEGTR